MYLCTMKRFYFTLPAMMMLIGMNAGEPIDVEYHASLTAQAASQRLAPYMIGSWNQGRYSQGNGLWQEGGLYKDIDLNRRFSWSAGFDYIAGVGSKKGYDRWDATSGSWTSNYVGVSCARVQQLFAEVKFRGVYLYAGMKNRESGIVDSRLSSGDFTRSMNARAIPGFSAGFIDFQDIPFTKGWLQIEGELMFGKVFDEGFRKKFFNHYSGLMTLDNYYTYQRCYFRTKPSQPFSIIIGLQAGGFFAGDSYNYYRGATNQGTERHFNIKELLRMWFPMQDGDEYYNGAHCGSWDFKTRYDFRNGSTLSAYFEWPWEDGSGIGRMNGWDGVWGLQYNFAQKGYLSKVLFEYVDFSNQSGPLHYAPLDWDKPMLEGHASGNDSYYNNFEYGPYSNYGMSIGSPFNVSPLYNTIGALYYLHTRCKGFHIALEGNPTSRLDYRAMFSYQQSGGNTYLVRPGHYYNTSAMVETTVRPLRKIPGAQITLQLALDYGRLRGNNLGALLKFSYTGIFSFKKHDK